MKRTFPIRFVLILVFSVSLAFPQQPQLNQNDHKSKRATAPIFGNCDYSVDPSKNPNDLPEITQPFRARGGSVDWGLALSGGGIRSATFNIGAMKALYDLGFLDRIDVISSVSGGGYASYWLFTNYDENGKKNFGEEAFRDDAFLRNVCNVPARTFFSLKSMVKAIFQTKKGAFGAYENAIRESFGNHKPTGMTPKGRGIDYLKPSIDKGDVPYFIINTTLGLPVTNPLCKVFEITPTHMGNPATGFFMWTQNDKKVLRWSESVAMSSAGVKFKLGRPVPNYASSIKAPSNAQLSDGGHSENLAAFSLIRREVKNIIIIDAGHDPEYEFKDYKKLRDSLCEMGVDFYVENIERFLDRRKKGDVYSKSSVSVGHARSRPTSGIKTLIDSSIYYLKMSRSESIFSEKDGKLANPTDFKSGRDYAENRRSKLEASGWNCNSESVAKFGFRSDMYIYAVKKYSDYINNHWFWKIPGKISSFLHYSFPHTTTVEQTFYRDQLDAFVGLGYLQAIELKEHRNW